MHKLQFLGKKKAKCKCQGGGVGGYESRTSYSLYSPFGIKTFIRGQEYQFDNEEEFNYWKDFSYKIAGNTINYFAVV